MSLVNYIKTLKKGEVLLPVLRDYLAKVEAGEKDGTISRKAGVIRDAQLTIKCFQKRLEEFDHGEDPEGEYFHPSQIGGCQRQAFFDIFDGPRDTKVPGTEEDPTRKYLIFETGTYVHVIIQNLCSRAGVLLKREIAIQDKLLKMLGHADGTLRIHGLKYLLEIKTINSVGYSKLTEPKHEHKAQATAYMKALGLKRAIFLYYDKDKCTMKEYVLQYDEKFYQEHVRARIDKFFVHVKKKTMPDREGNNPRGYPCMYCPWTRVCWESKLEAKFALQVKSMPNKHESKK